MLFLALSLGFFGRATVSVALLDLLIDSVDDKFQSIPVGIFDLVDRGAG